MRLTSKIIFTASILLLLSEVPSRAAGEIGIGFNFGLTYDQNNIEPEISRGNSLMIETERTNPGTDLTTLNIPYSPVIGANVRYTLNNFMMRSGVVYARPFLYPSSGNIALPASPDNVIKYDSYSLSFPLQLCLVMKPGAGTSVYFGAGAAAHISYLSITQTNTGGLYVKEDVAAATYTASHIGWNFIAGVEAPLSDRATATVELYYQNASSSAAAAQAGIQARTIDVTCPMILFGINYYLRLK